MKKMLALCTAIVLLTGIWMSPAAIADTDASATTPLDDASSAQLNNIELAVDALNGTFVAYGDTFSFNDVVGPRTEERGYKPALNGRGSKVTGGGVSQVAATLYLALQQLNDIEYTEKQTYGKKYTGDYVSSGSDAIVTDYGAGVDFSFVNNDGDFTIEMWTDDGEISCVLATGSGGSATGDTQDGGGASAIVLDSSKALRNNVKRACWAIDGTKLDSGETFSFNTLVGPHTKENGFVSAINGRGASVTGGGVAQVASALWLAVKDMDNVTVTGKSTYGDKYNQSYVDSADDAILVDYENGTDFLFRYDGQGTLTVYIEVQDDEAIMCEVAED